MDLKERIKTKTNIIKLLKLLGFDDMYLGVYILNDEKNSIYEKNIVYMLNDEKYSIYEKYIVYINKGEHTAMTYESVNEMLNVKLRLLKINNLENNINNPIRAKVKSKIRVFINNIITILITPKKRLLKWLEVN